MDEPHDIFTAYERESIRKMGQALQSQSRHFGKLHKNNPEVGGLMLAVFKLGVAVERFSTLNGHMEIWATFVPDMFAPARQAEEAGELTD